MSGRKQEAEIDGSYAGVKLRAGGCLRSGRGVRSCRTVLEIRNRIRVCLRWKQHQAQQVKGCRPDLSDQMTVNSQPHGDLCALCRPFPGDQENQAHADNLLCHLGKCGNPGFLGAVAVAVGAGVERSKGQGKPHDRKIRRCSAAP